MMRGLIVGVIAATALAAATPASAQGFYFGAPGVSVGVGAGPYYGYHRDYYHGPRAYHYYDEGPRVYARSPERCRTVWIERRDGSMRRVTRCR